MTKPKILLLGAGSQIAQSWIKYSNYLGELEVFYTSRKNLQNDSFDKLEGDLLVQKFPRDIRYVIDFVGTANPLEIANENPILAEAMKASLECAFQAGQNGARCIFISSGSVYDNLPGDGSFPASEYGDNFYVRHKRASELRFKASKVNFGSLRVFSFLSNSSHLYDGTLLGDMWNAWVHKNSFVTSPDDIVRDIVGEKDIALALDVLLQSNEIGPFDIFSTQPARKFEVAERLGLEVEIESSGKSSPTGLKLEYFSTDRRLGQLGYEPTQSSLDLVVEVFYNRASHLNVRLGQE